MSTLVQHFLEHSVDWSPDKTALIYGDQRLTYRQVEQMANQLAHALIQRGLKQGERIAVYLPNSVEAVVSIFGILKAGGVFVVLNPTTKKDKLIYILSNCRAVGFFTSSLHTELASELQKSIPSLDIAVICPGRDQAVTAAEGLLDFYEWIQAYPTQRPTCRNIDQDLACLIYTSGSTGEPKGVVCGHNNVSFASNSIITYLENQKDDIIINVLPLSFDYGLYQLLMAFRFGGTLVLEKSFAYPAQILQAIEKEKVTGFPIVPTVAAMILQMSLKQYDLSSLRYITNTAAALPPQHITALQNKLPGVTIYSMYGLTECKRTLYLPPEQLRSRPGSVGIAIPGTEVWLEDEEGNRLGAGQVGELVIRGSHVMRGYWEDAEATAKVYRPGPTPEERILYSGDLFQMDQEGYLYFISRKDDIIKSRGEKVSPKEVENVLYSIKGIVETAVVGIPDPILGQAIKAYVVSKDDNLTEKDIKRYCTTHLESFMVPQQVEFREKLPKTSSGKISKRAIESESEGDSA